MSNIPPYHFPVYIKNVRVSSEVAEVTEDASGKRLVDVDYPNPTAVSQQQWNLEPWNLDKNEFFIKLNSDTTYMLQSPVQEGDQAFMALQGDFYKNGGIQVWTVEHASQFSPTSWIFRNYKTEMQLYLEMTGGQPKSKMPVTVRIVSPTDQNTHWLIEKLTTEPVWCMITEHNWDCLLAISLMHA